MKNKLDVTKCMGCKKGLTLFFKDDKGFKHVDLFSSYASGSEYKCENSDTVGEFLYEQTSSKYLTKEEFMQMFKDQDFWWEDIIDLAHAILKESKDVTDFFNEGEPGKMNWNLSNEDLESKLLELAKENDISTPEDSYPDLIKFKK